MEYRQLGKHGLKVSELSLGSWITFGEMIDDDRARDCMLAAYEAGVNYFDNADVYAEGKSEIIMGKIMKDLKRSDLVISSKAYWPMGTGPNDKGLSRKHIVESVHNSLERFGTDYLDLFFCHRYDTETPLEEVVRALDDLVHQGKILYWGTSAWRGAQISDAVGVANRWGLYAPAVEQPHYHMFQRDIVETELVEAARQHGVGIVVWSPLNSGILSGKYNDGVPKDSRVEHHEWLRGALTDEKLDKVRRLTTLAGELDATMAQLALAWLLRMPELSSIITGATRIGQIEENLKAVDVKKQLTPEILERIEAILQNDPNAE